MAVIEDIWVKAAQVSQKATGIPSSVTLAQFILESGWGIHMPGNNPFGIKAVPGQNFTTKRTREVIHGQEIFIDAKFAAFDTLADAFIAHGRLLAGNPRYAEARKYENSPDAFADHLTGIYATDPNYGTLLKRLIDGHNLTQYDRV